MPLVNIPNDYARSVAVEKELKMRHATEYKALMKDYGMEVGSSLNAYLAARFPTEPKKTRQDLVNELKSHENALTSVKRDQYTVDYINRTIFDLKNDIQTGNYATSVEEIQYNASYKQAQEDYYYSDEHIQLKNSFDQKVLQKCQELFLL